MEIFDWIGKAFYYTEVLVFIGAILSGIYYGLIKLYVIIKDKLAPPKKDK